MTQADRIIERIRNAPPLKEGDVPDWALLDCSEEIAKCIESGADPDECEKYKHSPYDLKLILDRQLRRRCGQPTWYEPKSLTPHQQWCEDRAEFDE